MKSSRFHAIFLLALISFLGQVGYTQDHFDVPGTAPERGEIRKHASDHMPDKTGESVAAHTHGRWRWYKPNPWTISEKKNRPFWIKVRYHGGWYRTPGFQPRAGSFHLANHFVVWEHDPRITLFSGTSGRRTHSADTIR
jgi:hypothetical protein